MGASVEHQRKIFGVRGTHLLETLLSMSEIYKQLQKWDDAERIQERMKDLEEYGITTIYNSDQMIISVG